MHSNVSKIAEGIKLEIEKGQPIPKHKRYPFEKMEIGDSMFFENLREVESAQNAAYSYAKLRDNGFRTTRRKLEDGYRLWRIA